MKISNIVLIVALGFLINGCGEKTEKKAAEQKLPEESRSAAQSAIPDYQLKALEKAKGVENTLQDSAEERKEAIEKEGI